MERGGGGLFMRFPPELLLEILKHLYLHDIGSLRCVSKWFDDQICSLMSSKFRRFKITFGGRIKLQANYESISRAMKKPNGYHNMLDVTDDITCFSYYLVRKVLDVVRKILDENKNNISALNLSNYYYDWNSKSMDKDLLSFLQHENTIFRSLEKLAIWTNSKLLENLLKKHAKQLTYLQIKSFFNVADLPKFPKLETVIVQEIRIDALIPLLSSCSKSLSKLKIIDFFEEGKQICKFEGITSQQKAMQIPKLPKLETFVFHYQERIEFIEEDHFIEVNDFGTILLLKCRQSLSGISFCTTTFNMEDTYFPSVKYLRFHKVPAECVNDFISGHACQLETLMIDEIYDFICPDSLPKMKNVLVKRCGNVPNLLKCAPSIQCLVTVGHDLKDTTKMPNLTDLYLIRYHYHGKGKFFLKESILKLLVNNADSLEFLVFKDGINIKWDEFNERNTVELKNVHTVIVFEMGYTNKKDPFEIDRDFFQSLCPNAQIMTTGDCSEYIFETLNLRLKYLRADEFFRDNLDYELGL